MLWRLQQSAGAERRACHVSLSICLASIACCITSLIMFATRLGRQERESYVNPVLGQPQLSACCAR